MRSFFNKPSWASEGVGDGDSEFYRRAAQTYKDIVATDKSARERRANSVQSSPHKHRRISSSTSKDENTTGLNNGQEVIYEPKNISRNFPSRDIQHDASHDNSAVTQVSCYNNASSTDLNGSTSSRPSVSPRRELSEPRAYPTSLPPTDTIGNTEADAHENHRSQGSAAPTETDTSCTDRKSAYDQAVVQILITSKIENTKPLMVHRKMSQPLKGVRLAWCTHQNLPTDLHPLIFLTWRGRRLFDVTTCRSLNIDVHDSTFAKELSPFGDIFSDTDDFRVHMEAVTEEMYASRNRTSPNNAGCDQTPSKSTESQDAEQHTLSEIVLKCPRLDDFKIRVTLQTQIFKVLAAFREARRVSTELNVYLAFDGDRLDPQSCLADYEITDGDLVDVLVKKAM
ncbi:ubiquitin-2 like Rad60 SUMO-like-domain-containing protein [Aspergillus californicus]